MRAIRLAIGLLLLPLAVALTRAVGVIAFELAEARGGITLPAGAFAGGVLLWIFTYATVPRPLRTYVLAHELTHALWGALFGEKVLHMSVSRDQGSVTLSDSNFLITLAPYFFPLYTALVLAAYFLLGAFFRVERCEALWLAAIGYSWGFHFTFTLSSLLQRQSDIRQCGHLFSYVVIYSLNLFGVGLGLAAVTRVTLDGLFGEIARQSALMAAAAWDLCLALAQIACNKAGR